MHDDRLIGTIVPLPRVDSKTRKPMVDETGAEVVRPAILWIDPSRKAIKYFYFSSTDNVGPGPSLIRWGQCAEFTPKGQQALFACRFVSRPNPLWKRIAEDIEEGYGDDWNRATVARFNGRTGIAELDVNGSKVSFTADDIVRRDYGDCPSLRVGATVYMKLGRRPLPGKRPAAFKVIDLEDLTPSE